MVKVTFEFGTQTEAAAFLGGTKAAAGDKPVRGKKENKIEDPLADAGDDDFGDLGGDAGDDDFGDSATTKTPEKPLKEKIQERAAALAAAGKKDAVIALVGKAKVKKLSDVYGLTEKHQEKFLELLNKISI